MSDTYGDTDSPLAVPAKGESAGDTAAKVICDFAAAVLNADVQPAWSAVCPGKKVVESSFTYDPEKKLFVGKNLPALYGWRDKGDKFTRGADEWQASHDVFHMRWVFPREQNVIARLRAPVVGTLSKSLDRALFDGRHPAYVHPQDPDIWAPTFVDQPGVILRRKATSTAPASYAGNALDGLLAGKAVPSRGVILDIGGTPADWVNGSKVTVLGKDVMGGTYRRVIAIASARVPYRLYTTEAVTEVTSVSLEAQATTAGTIAVGLGGRRGYGTAVIPFTGVDLTLAKPATFQPVKIVIPGSKKVMEFAAVAWVLKLYERLDRSPAAYPEVGAGISTLGAPAEVAGAQVSLQPDGGAPIDAQFP